ncbi:MAG: M20/M25/M40 family metallo-hydrolase [Chloroflexota bacterium]
MISEFEDRLRSQIKARGALKHIDALSAIGDRFVGSDGDARAIEYISGEFKRLGLEVACTDIEVPSFVERQVELRLVGVDRRIEAIAAYFSPGTPPEGIVTDLVFVGDGEEADYQGVDVRNRIVVLQESGLGYSKFWLGAFAARAAKHGALAVVVIHPMPWPYRMSMEAGNSNIDNRFLDEQVPAVCVSSIDGALLMRAIGGGQSKVWLKADVARPTVKSCCISGFLWGKELPDERVAIVAHRDNGFPPGANDNGSGSGTMLEVARVLSGYQPRRTMEFISSTAEEGVTQGVWAYIQAHKDDLRQMKALIDLDMFGVGGRLNLVDIGLWPDREPLKHTEWLMQMLEEIADDLGYQLGRMTAGWGVAESGRFLAEGVPSAWFWRPDDMYYHSIHDTPDKIDGNSLKVVGDITAIAAWRLANQ